MTDFVDYGGVNDRIKAFDKRHGAPVYHDYWYHFPDGACRERNALGALIDPPADPFDRARRIALYYKIIMDSAVREFDAAKMHLHHLATNNLKQARCGPAPELNGSIAELKVLQAKVLVAKGNFEKAMRAVEAAKPERDKASERMDRVTRGDNTRLLEAINKIEV